MKKTIILLFFTFFFTLVWGQDITPMRNKVKNGYNFWLYKPTGWNAANTQKPLIVFLHGASLCGRNLNRVRRYGPLDALDRGRKIDAYIVAPQCPGGGWNPVNLMNMVDWVTDHYPVDTNRIYVLGMSLGGYGTIDFAATFPDRIAAAMAICGGGTVNDYEPLNQMPLWILHGTADRAVSIHQSDRIVEAMMKNSDAPRLIYTRLKGMNHGAPARIFYLKETYDWLLSHSLKDTGRPVNKKYVINPEIIRNAYSDLTRKGHLAVATEVDVPVTSETKQIAQAEEEQQEVQQQAEEQPEVQQEPAKSMKSVKKTSASGIYKVRSGDNLYSLAKKNHTTVDKIKKLNHLTSDKLSLGQRLRLK